MSELPQGRRLGVYEIRSLLGRGGMGEVYRAHDSRLRRDVAIKILPDTLTGDPDRLIRFEREALALAALNHPNIAAIYGVEERALILELVEGETLAERLERGPLRPTDAIAIALQIAEGLEAAHEAGIVHRDLKPANIKITPSGLVKLLDFGIAKVSVSHDDQTRTGTELGTVIGTAAYMSPEQARGQAVDKRSDIWAFGCVLFELLSGRHAFAKATATDTLAAILEHEPDWSALPTSTPVAVMTLLRRCLVKDPRNRLRDIGEARVALAPGQADAPATSRKKVSRILQGRATQSRRSAERRRLGDLRGCRSVAADRVMGRWWHDRLRVSRVGRDLGGVRRWRVARNRRHARRQRGTGSSQLPDVSAGWTAVLVCDSKG